MKRAFIILALAGLTATGAVASVVETDEVEYAGSEKQKQALAALEDAIREGDAAEVRRLVESGVDVNGKTLGGNGFVVEAARVGTPEILLCLIEHGADVNAEGVDFTPLHMALSFGESPLETVRILLEHGAAPNCADKQTGRRPLHLAVRDVEIVKCLLEHGADVNARSYIGETAWDRAKGLGKEESLKVLEAHGGKSGIYPNGKDGYCSGITQAEVDKGIADLKRLAGLLRGIHDHASAEAAADEVIALAGLYITPTRHPSFFERLTRDEKRAVFQKAGVNPEWFLRKLYELSQKRWYGCEKMDEAF